MFLFTLMGCVNENGDVTAAGEEGEATTAMVEEGGLLGLATDAFASNSPEERDPVIITRCLCSDMPGGEALMPAGDDD